MMTNATRDEYKSVVYAGCAIESKGISVCNLEDFLRTKLSVPRAKYQVCSDRHRVHELFYTLDEAIDKFLELKNKQR